METEARADLAAARVVMGEARAGWGMAGAEEAKVAMAWGWEVVTAWGWEVVTAWGWEVVMAWGWGVAGAWGWGAPAGLESEGCVPRRTQPRCLHRAPRAPA